MFFSVLLTVTVSPRKITYNAHKHTQLYAPTKASKKDITADTSPEPLLVEPVIIRIHIINPPGPVLVATQGKPQSIFYERVRVLHGIF